MKTTANGDRIPRKAGSGLANDDSGMIVVYIALAFAFFLPLAALALDYTRYLNLNTELEQAAEAAALAAAQELNFTDAGRTAADTAARSAVENFQSFATDDPARGQVAIADVQFLQALPPHDDRNPEAWAAYETADPVLTRYVRVVTETRALESPFFTAFEAFFASDGDSVATKTTQGSAVAGKSGVICGVLPLLMCNPAEDYGTCSEGTLSEFSPHNNDLAAWLADSSNRDFTRRQWLMRFLPPGTALEVPGTVAWLQPANRSGSSNALRDEMARDPSPVCVSFGAAVPDTATSLADSRTGVDALNVRLDLYGGSLSGLEGSPDFRPAPNVVKGYDDTGGTCAPVAADPPLYSALPRADCFADSSCPDVASGHSGLNGELGGIEWDTRRYFRATHPDLFLAEHIDAYDAAVAAGCTFFSTGPADCDPALTPLQETAIEEFDDRITEVVRDIQDWYDDHLTEGQVTLETTAGEVDVNDPPARYAVYRCEIDSDCKVDPTGIGLGGGDPLGIPGPSRTDAAEEGAPQCSPYAADPAEPERRLLRIGVTDCCRVRQAAGGGAVSAWPIDEVAEIFLTEPAESGGPGGESGSIHGELVRIITPETPNSPLVRREYVQLY